MVFFSTTGLLLHVALFPPGTTHDCAIGQAGPSIWSRLPPPSKPRSYEGALEKAERAAAGKLLQPCSPKRGGGARNDQSDPQRRVYRTRRTVPVRCLRAGDGGVEARVHDRAWSHAASADGAGA